MTEFHFIRPLWLFALIGLIATLYLLKKYRINQSGWQQLLPKHLANVLIDGKSTGKPRSLMLPFIIGLLAITALAGPTWKKLPQPVYQLARGSVLVMDMSYSMYATDVTPNRLTRARYKAIDLLEHLNEGEIGLVAYAGDAFAISPLTEDINNIALLLPSLSPDLMPELGSYPYAALSLASQMLKNAGHVEGDIYWFTDGIDQDDVQDLTEWVRSNPYRLNIMGIGTKAGAPIKLPNGQLLKDDSGAIVIPKLSQSLLKTVSNQGSGEYSAMMTDSSDIELLIMPPIDQDKNNESESSQTGDQWQEFGPYLLLLILPLVLSYFRRGNILAIIPLVLFFAPSQPVYADFWQDLWQTKDQQGQKLYENEKFSEAAQSFDNPMWKGSSYYQAGDYENALKAFQQADGAEALYNQGNSLAKLQQLDEAINAYEKALALKPDHQDAKENKALIEKLKEQQEQNKQQNQDQEQNQDQDQDQDQDQENKQDQQQNNQNQQSSQDQQSSDKEQDQKQKQDSQSKQSEEEQKKPEQEKPQNSDENTGDKNKEQQEQLAQMQQAQQDKELEQKHQQLLNKVTDDPYLLLRNKMQLEYQKRRQSRSRVGENKKW